MDDFDQWLADLKADLDSGAEIRDDKPAAPAPAPSPAPVTPPQVSRKTDSRPVPKSDTRRAAPAAPAVAKSRAASPAQTQPAVPADDFVKLTDFEAKSWGMHKDGIMAVCERRPGFSVSDAEFLHRYKPGRKVYQFAYRDGEGALIPEPQNRHDPNAIGVYVDGYMVGYVPAELCRSVKALIASPHRVVVSIHGGPWKVNRETFVEVGAYDWTVDVQIWGQPRAAQQATRQRNSQAQPREKRGRTCPKCGGMDISYQAVSKVKEKRKKGWAYWLFIGWWWEPLMWICFGIFKLLHVIFSKKTRTVTKVETYAVCQSCGYRWKA